MRSYLTLCILMMVIISSFSAIGVTEYEHTFTYDEIIIIPISQLDTDPITISCSMPPTKYDWNGVTRNNLPTCPTESSYGYDYVIITTSTLEETITASSFISWKESLGYTIKIVRISDTEIQDQTGHDLPAKIRSFLREYYPIWGIKYVLIVGDHATIPMRYCYPDPTNHENTAGTVGGSGGDVPTDYYYADLSAADEESWDSDGDGYYGEYDEDIPDFLAEVAVGRIPSNDPSRIRYALDKTVRFEQDTGEWKNSALHAGAFWYFTNENNNGADAYDGATCMNEIELNFMNGWTISHYSEQEGLEKSRYNWPSFSENAFAHDWKTGQYSVVNWGAHGWSNGASQKIWSWDDGDNIPESHEISWKSFISTHDDIEDDYPSIVFGISCVINYPEFNPDGQIGVDLLTKPSFGASVGVVASTRSPWGTSNWPTNPGGAESICYEFNRFMLCEHERIGDALFKAMYYCTSNYGWASWHEYNNLYCFNLYGDPSLKREGVEHSAPTAPIIHGPTSGTKDVEYNFSFMSVDPTDDDISYYIEWGDGEAKEWIGPYESGEEITIAHTWREKGTYSIRAKAKDENGDESSWTTFTVTMPRVTLYTIITQLFETQSHIFLLVRNLNGSN